jgi:hypothetical protein
MYKILSSAIVFIQQRNYYWLDESDLMLLYINLCQVFIIKNNSDV